MAIFRTSLLGSPNVGIYALTADEFVLVPVQTTEAKAKRLGEVLGGKVVRTSVGGTRLIGVLAVANSNGIVLPHFTADEEVKELREVLHVNVERVECRATAFGNLVLANDRGGIVSNILAAEGEALRRVKDVLGVELVAGEVAGLPYVGAAAVASSKGVLAHPLLRESERKVLEDVLGVQTDVGTINGGCPFMGSGVLASGSGVVIGSLATGPEILAISNVLE